MRRRSLLAILSALGIPILALAGPKSDRPAKISLGVPPKALLIGKSGLDQIRELPELQEKTSDKIVRRVGVSAIDQLYESDRSYAETVIFFEKQFTKENVQTLKKNITNTSTAWTVRRPDNALIDVVVRNTTPPTFEVIEATHVTPVPESAPYK